MALFTIILSTSIRDVYSIRPLFNIRDGRCLMHRPQSIISNIIIKEIANIDIVDYLSVIVNNLYMMHHKYDNFNGVHVYLQSNHISLKQTAGTELSLL